MIIPFKQHFKLKKKVFKNVNFFNYDEILIP